MKILLSLVGVLCYVSGVYSAVFTVRNNCPYKIWPATLSGSGTKIMSGFELAPQGSNKINVPSPWSGRFWARFECSTGNSFTCLSGDCGSDRIECNGAGGAPPVSLVEFTLAGANGNDFYDISLVDGFNLPVSVKPDNPSCTTTSCPVDINNKACPSELSIKDPNGGVIGCKSACVAFNQPQYCCTGAFSTPATCKPTRYSTIFKQQCPQAYSYAYDDASSTFTCPTGANYVITFCP